MRASADIVPRFDRDSGAEGPIVRGFVNGGFKLDDGVYRGLLMSPTRAAEWTPPSLAEIVPEDLEDLLALEPAPEFLLLGTGARFSLAPREVREALEARGIGVEAMDSKAAARAWGMLRSEGRWIVAALMPLDN